MRALVALLLPLPMFAADLTVRDVRLEVGPGDVSSFDGEIRYRSGPNSMFATQTVNDDEYGGSSPFCISAMYSRADLAPIGFLWAAGIEWQTSHDDVGDDTFYTDLIGAKARLGIGWTPAPFWRLEATAEGHLGYMRTEDADVDSGGNLDYADATGAYSAIGLQLGAGYAIKGRWEVGVSLRAMTYSAQLDADFDRTGGSYEAEYDWVMLSAAVVGGYRF